MSERRNLIDGLKATPPTIDPGIEKTFVHGSRTPNGAGGSGIQPGPAAVPVINRVPISTRMREDFAKALKRASLERQLEGMEPSTLQDILEQAIEPWLKSNGYLP